MGADIAKIACKINSQQDNARIMDVITQDSKVIAIGMGAKGLITRVTAPLMGSPFTYACLEKGKETADGQIDYKTLESAIKEISRNRGKL
ncbi:type I 3-dehydroquinate dehydratase, partial [Candidatus Micrarchaeota archaeon]|nr:type I 3-dehydroquinate dehydratase [Candidatus Micrarchaeota archaeon]